MDYKQRFSSRVENYIKYRPGYPESIISILQLEIGLMVDDIVADIGSGTGLSAKLFLENGLHLQAQDDKKNFHFVYSLYVINSIFN